VFIKLLFNFVKFVPSTLMNRELICRTGNRTEDCTEELDFNIIKIKRYIPASWPDNI